MAIFTAGMAVAGYFHQTQQNAELFNSSFERLETRVLKEVSIRMQQYEFGLRVRAVRWLPWAIRCRWGPLRDTAPAGISRKSFPVRAALVLYAESRRKTCRIS